MGSLLTFATSNLSFDSAAPRDILENNRSLDLIQFLSIAQHTKTDFLPITWAPFEELAGRGGSAQISQSQINIQTSFAFKRFSEPRSDGAELVFKALASEIRVLQNPHTRSSPHVVKLQGICWEFDDSSGTIYPVLVFLRPNMEIYIHTCVAKIVKPFLSTQDSNDVVHGDIKPQNVLLYKSSDGPPVVAVTDFAYSCLGRSETDIVRLPRSPPWQAPEWHHRGFPIAHAKKMDIYSFGMLCAWVLFGRTMLELKTERAQIEDCQAGSIEALLSDLKERQVLFETLCEIMKQDLPNDPERSQRLVHFFAKTICDDQDQRVRDIGSLISYLDPLCGLSSFCQSTNKNPFENEEEDTTDFRIPSSLLQLVWVDFRLRTMIYNGLKAKVHRGSTTTQKRAAFQLAICYHIGFGTARDMSQVEYYLKLCSKRTEDLRAAVAQVEDQRVFQPGKFLELWTSGFISPVQYPQHYRDHGQQVLAKKEYARTIADFEIAFGDQHFLVQNLKEILADILQDEGKDDEAVELLNRVLACRQRISKVHPVTLAVETRLASVLERQGNFAEAERLASSAMAKSKELLGPNHPQVILGLAGLSSVFEKLQRWREVEELDRQVLEFYISMFGEEHPNTIKARINLASAMRALALKDPQRLREVEQLQAQVMAISKKCIGPEHTDTLNSMSNLAATYQEQQRWVEAEQLMREVLVISERCLGHNHPDNISSLGHLAANLNHQKRWTDAENLLVQAQELSLKVHGADHQQRLTIMGNLAEVYRKQDKLAEAEILAHEVLERRSHLFGFNHPDTITSMISLAVTYWLEGRLGDATDLYWDAVSVSIEVHGAKHPQTLRISHDLAVCLHGQGSHEDAVALMKEVVAQRDATGIDSTTSNQFLHTWQ